MDSPFIPSACSKHPQEMLQNYCSSCRELLCIKCVMSKSTNVHHSHRVIDYKRYLLEEQRKAEEVLHQLNDLLSSAEKFKTELSNAVAEFELSCKESEEGLESFNIVKKEMNEWQKNVLSGLEEKKVAQVTLLDNAIIDAQKNEINSPDLLKITFPKVTIHKLVRNNLQAKAHELVPQNFSYFEDILNRKSSTSEGELYSTIEDDADGGIYDNDTDEEEEQELGEDHYESFVPQTAPPRPPPPQQLPNDSMCAPPLPPPPIQQRQQYGHIPRLSEGPPLPPSPISQRQQYDRMPPLSEHSLLPPSPISQRQQYDHMPPLSDRPPLPPPPIPQRQQYDHMPPHECLPLPSSIQQRQQYDHIPPLNGRPPLPPRSNNELDKRYDHPRSSREYENYRRNSEPWSHSYQKLNPSSEMMRSGSYAIPGSTAKPRSFTYPRISEMVIPPNHTILPSCFAESPSESVFLFDVCITTDGMMIFSDSKNNCLRCMLGTSENSKIKTKRFKDGAQPHALAYDKANHRIMVGTNKGLYQVDCSTHLTKMKEKKLADLDVVPLSMTCSTIGNKKDVTVHYMTLWSLSGNNGIFKYANGNYESCITSQDLSKPYGIDYMNQYLVVTNINEGTIMKISHTGGPLWDASVDARKPGILDQPYGVAIIPQTEYIAVTEPGIHRVSIFTDRGKLFLRLGRKGTGRGEFESPQAIAVRLFQELVVIDNNRVQIFSLSSLGVPFFNPSSQGAPLFTVGEAVYDTIDLS